MVKEKDLAVRNQVTINNNTHCVVYGSYVDIVRVKWVDQYFHYEDIKQAKNRQK